MFKIDQVNNFFDCDVCHKLLVDPITTPCGYSICKRHLDKLLSEKAYKCRICREEHSIPKEGLVINKRIQIGLNIKLNTLKLNPVFDECKERLLKTRSNLSRIETLQKEPENFIFEYFEEIKRKVDLRRECLKLKIDSYYNDMIKSIEATKVNCMRLSKEVNRLTTDLEKSKKELTELLERFDTFLISDKKFEDIKESACVINQSLAIIFKEYTDSLIGNKKYSFEFKEFQIEDVFGRFVEKKSCSTIMNTEQLKLLIKICGFPREQKWELKYRASRDGFKALDFHSKCDGVENTLTIIKTTNGNVFGGYTEQAWNSYGHAVADPSAFIFSLINEKNRPFKVLCVNGGRNAIGGYGGNGPTFGDEYPEGICIRSDSNLNQYSYSNFGALYKHAEYPWGSEEARSILAGSYYFQTVEIEVFNKKEQN